MFYFLGLNFSATIGTFTANPDTSSATTGSLVANPDTSSATTGSLVANLGKKMCHAILV